MDELQIITLLLTPGIGVKTVMRILTSETVTGCEPEELLGALSRVKQRYGRLALPTQSALDVARTKARKVLDTCHALGITAVGWDNPDYPARLKAIPDPPAVLYAKGVRAALKQALAIAVIGTREPSDYGARVAERFGARFAQLGVTVVSGLAIGCDTAAHRGCLMEDGTTVAVLAHGLDMVYPKQNADLAAQILAKSGALVSEYPPGAAPQSRYFVERDRLQSGLSDAVVVVETDVKGGTMHTARFCRDQGRLLAAFVHPVEKANAKSRGNELLIQQRSAIALGDDGDILAIIERLRKDDVRNQTPTGPSPDAETKASGQLSMF